MRVPPALATAETGSGPAALLIHGWTGFKESWGLLPAALADAGLRAVAVDLPGWGGSPAPRGFAHTPEAYAEALRPLVERLAPVALVAHSMGAQPAVLLAAGGAPVRALVAISPAFVPAGRLRRPERISDVVRWPLVGRPSAGALLLAAKRGPERLWLEALRGSVADPEAAEDPELVALGRRALEALRATPTRVLTASLAATAAYDLRPAASRAGVPALVVVGERDRTIHPGEAASLAGALPAGRLLRVARAGHLPHLERPEVVVPAVVAGVRG
jgi:pimeloyl-ACP methyl ester carboxylesterase